MMDHDDNLPLSIRYQRVGEEWADAEAAAQLLEDLKSAVLSQRCAALGDIPVNRAEQMVKASADWRDYIEQMVDARKKANVAKVKMESLRMEYGERQSADANRRTEMRMLGE